MTSIVKISIIIVLVWIFQGCAQSGEDEESTPGETIPPALQIRFPSSHSLTILSSINIYGQSNDASGIKQVTINDVPVDSSDGYLTWQASINLFRGTNELVVQAMDRQGNISEVTMYVTYDPAWLSSMTGLTGDGSVLYVSDDYLQAVIKVNPITGDRTIVSSASTGSGPLLQKPAALAFDSNNATLWVADLGMMAIVGINPITGDRQILSQNDDNSGSTINFVGLKNLAVLNNKLYVAEQNNAVDLIEVDLNSGLRQHFADTVASMTSYDNLTIRGLRAIPGVGMFATDLAGNIISIAADSDRSLAGDGFLAPDQLDFVSSIDMQGALVYQLYVTELFNNCYQVMMSGNTLTVPCAQSSAPLHGDNEIKIQGDWLYITDDPWHAVLASPVSDTYAPVFVSQTDFGNGSHVFELNGIETISSAAGKIFGMDNHHWISYDLATGDKQLLTMPLNFCRPRLTVTNDSVFMVPCDGSDLFKTDLTGGGFSSYQYLSGIAPSDLAFEQDSGRLFMIEKSGDLYQINNSTGAIVATISDNTNLSLGPALVQPEAMTIRQGSAYILDADASSISILQVNLTSGQRQLIIGNPPTFADNGYRLVDITHYNSSFYMMVDNNSTWSIHGFQMDSGMSPSAVSVVSDINRGEGPSFLKPFAMIYDEQKNVLYVSDEKLAALFMVDVVSGDRVVMAR